ncbi:alanine racemase [Gephyromycinifex aptenodytis]|uniref:alanine racemase n=1 Tax=Gephyromycinifex aptenodytis TaxID=2716227 RepID=UPI001446F059|nr:alanine racemase [Gephyromycinifex aptenodytis]
MLYKTHARVDLEAIRHNLRGIRAAVGASRKVLMAVKANAYGHGAVPVCRAVEAAGLADWFGVATVPEAIELRRGGIHAPILKLSHAFDDELDAAIAAEVTLSLVSEPTALAAEAAAARMGGTPVPVHLKIDTGMGRIGVAPQDAAAVARLIESECPHLHLQGIFTHFPASDTPEQAEFTANQIARFAASLEQVQAAIGREVELVHAANSGGVLAHEESWFTMVRPGIMAYGYYPDESTPRTIDLQPALTWATQVSFLKRVEAGTSVGYGRTWAPRRPTWIATIPVGYADGFDRHLSNRGQVLIGGRAYPVVGRVCMDQTMIDVGADPQVQVGDEAVLLGVSGSQRYTAQDMAQDLGTISYEITCSLAPRVRRLYI